MCDPGRIAGQDQESSKNAGNHDSRPDEPGISLQTGVKDVEGVEGQPAIKAGGIP